MGAYSNTVSIIVPARNESVHIRQVLDRIPEAMTLLYEVLIFCRDRRRSHDSLGHQLCSKRLSSPVPCEQPRSGRGRGRSIALHGQGPAGL